MALPARRQGLVEHMTLVVSACPSNQSLILRRFCHKPGPESIHSSVPRVPRDEASHMGIPVLTVLQYLFSRRHKIRRLACCAKARVRLASQPAKETQLGSYCCIRCESPFSANQIWSCTVLASSSVLPSSCSHKSAFLEAVQYSTAHRNALLGVGTAKRHGTEDEPRA